MIHKIKALHNEGAGLSIRSIARELGISRNTVRKYLRMDEVAIGEEQERRTRHKQLDDYRDSIVTLLEQFTNLSVSMANKIDPLGATKNQLSRLYFSR